MLLPTVPQTWLPAMALLTAISRVAGQSDSCATNCEDYNSILVNCQSESGSGYDLCVCNDPNFQSYVAECISCEGTDSDPYKFQQNCKSVPPDCTIACQGFGIILQNCGDASAAGFASCVCSSAYDETYSNTFNQDFQDCVSCENGGGHAADWEAQCCALTNNCVGMSPQASSEVATVQVSPTTTTPAPTTTTPQPDPLPTTTGSGDAAGYRAANVLGLGIGQVALNALIGIY